VDKADLDVLRAAAVRAIASWPVALGPPLPGVVGRTALVGKLEPMLPSASDPALRSLAGVLRWHREGPDGERIRRWAVVSRALARVLLRSGMFEPLNERRVYWRLKGAS
jgi:hypothetical protein